MPNRLPLHERHLASGAKLDTVGDWELPLTYGDAADEYMAARRRAVLVDRGHYGILEVAGRDRATFLHALLSNEVKALAPGQGCAATLLDVHGKVQVVLSVWVLDDRILLVVPPGTARKVLEALDHYLFSEKVSLRDASEETALFLLVGPEACALVERLTGVRPPERPWAHVAATLDGAAVRLVTGDGETGGAEIWCATAAADTARVWAALVNAGARPVGLTALESLRIEAGTPRFGHDVDESVLLPEIPLERLVSYTKGCYPGQEVVVRIRDRGHAEVVADGGAVGRVTSAVRSFGLGQPIALAFVKRQHAKPDTAVSVRVGERTIAARVSGLPFTR